MLEGITAHLMFLILKICEESIFMFILEALSSMLFAMLITLLLMLSEEGRLKNKEF